MTVSELAAAGLPAILVPYPHAIDDHQTANARFLAQADAAVLIPQSELTPQHLAEHLQAFTQHPERLTAMAQAARNLAKPDAAQQVADLCLAEIRA
jgi:UDP-N-acetylglucosamine--N-acetylmuramyl-(pentapeptide) pyrophosphoryl-undecaprenol N-acetylglucosamine transferase